MKGNLNWLYLRQLLYVMLRYQRSANYSFLLLVILTFETQGTTETKQ